MELYYYLLNEVSVSQCNSWNMDISSNKSNKAYNIRIENILAKLTGNAVKIRLVDAANDITLKATMIDSFKSSDQWKILEDNFPGAKILDMVHKSGGLV